MNTTGNFRPLKFVKHLPAMGILPIVVTFKAEQGARYFNAALDPSLLNELPQQVPVYRIDCDEPKIYRSKVMNFLRFYFSIHDSFAVRWKRNLLSQLPSIVHRHRPKLVFTTLPPFSSGGLAVDIADRFNLPLVIDMRDLYSKWGSSPSRSRVHFWLANLDERRLFSKAKVIVAATPQLSSIFKSSHPKINEEKFYHIPNGFDVNVDAIKDFYFQPHRKKVVIGYVGSFYYEPELHRLMNRPWWKRPGYKGFFYSPQREDWLYRSPYYFFKALTEMFKKWPSTTGRVSVEFIGKTPLWLQQMVSEFKLENIVIYHGFVSHQRALEIQNSFDLFLVTSEKVVGGEHYCLPSKVFDFVGKAKPILGFVTQGVLKDFLANSNLGVICNPDDPETSASNMYSLISQGEEFKVNRNYLSLYSRKETAAKLGHLLRAVCDTCNV